jgi:hypothetical protein
MVQINGDHMIRRRLCSAHAMNVKHLHGLMAECVMADRYIVCRRHATLHGQVVAGRHLFRETKRTSAVARPVLS